MEWGLFPFMPDATTLVVGEAFKVSGNILMVRAVMADMPAGAWNGSAERAGAARSVRMELKCSAIRE